MAARSSSRSISRSPSVRAGRRISVSAAGRTRGFAPRITTSLCCSTATCGWRRIFCSPCSMGSRTKKSFRSPARFSSPTRTKFAKRRALRNSGGSTEASASVIGLTETIRDLYPCAYGGGGSCAFDRRKFLELGGFDELLAPFYLEDTDLGYMAWKRGWKNLYQPASVVYHEHRGTIGTQIQRRLHSGRPQEELSCCSPGRTSTNGGGWWRISRTPGRARC